MKVRRARRAQSESNATGTTAGNATRLLSERVLESLIHVRLDARLDLVLLRSVTCRDLQCLRQVGADRLHIRKKEPGTIRSDEGNLPPQRMPQGEQPPPR